MDHCINEDHSQFNSKEEIYKSLGLDPETIEGDYCEYFQRMHKMFQDAKIDMEFSKKVYEK